jgi:hypothetical protein
MARAKTSRMIYLGGHSGRKGLLGVLAFPEAFPSDTEYTVFYMTLAGEWGQHQFEFDIPSVTYQKIASRNYSAWWLVGKRGEVVEIDKDPRIERIDTAGTGRGKYGYLAQIRLIDGQLFICGYRRQVYSRSGRGWDLISGEMLDKRPKGPWNGFESIDGFSRNDLYAVGDEGEIWHYDGKNWTQCESPTNCNLADVRCLGDEVWICGDGGIILRGDKEGWDVVWADEKPSESWWSIEKFGGQIYVAGNSFLGKLQDGKVSPVNVGIKGTLTTRTLHCKEGILWSIGEQHIASFDGKKWLEHVVPENR